MTVGIVTAASGAALQDIINIATRRNPYVQLILSPALVQGERAAQSLIAAIERMDACHPDVMIVGRGGGSIEDLFAFNDEGVARAIFDCETPVISAVGHEVDYTIADFVADLRAPTPSAAAELAVFEYRKFEEELDARAQIMQRHAEDRIRNAKNRLEKARLRISGLHPKLRLERQKNGLFERYRAMEQLMSAKTEGLRHRLAILSERLNGRSPLSRLSGGYGYLSRDGKAVKNASDVRADDCLQVTLHDGRIDTKVLKVYRNE